MGAHFRGRDKSPFMCGIDNRAAHRVIHFPNYARRDYP